MKFNDKYDWSDYCADMEWKREKHLRAIGACLKCTYPKKNASQCPECGHEEAKDEEE